MKLYLAPGACSLADHIALHEAGLEFDRVKVDLKTRKTEDGQDYSQINPKGYVPTLQFDDGEVLTENVAILSMIADKAPRLTPDGKFGHFRLLEMLTFISTEIHKGFKPFFKANATDQEKKAAGELLGKRFSYLAERMKGDYLFGSRFTVADAYLFVMCLWAQKNGLELPRPLPAFVAHMKARPCVRLALEHEGLAAESTAS
ncbi:glutathione binding-like protein [Phenylobacterium sp.]|jgi:glutathione S-transferase|uniref:glutathione binding-like protein n=1 Tax=Phenylobacterium sp. TaxID=1871053 RepID=UPI002F3E5939